MAINVPSIARLGLIRRAQKASVPEDMEVNGVPPEKSLVEKQQAAQKRQEKTDKALDKVPLVRRAMGRQPLPVEGRSQDLIQPTPAEQEQMELRRRL